MKELRNFSINALKFAQEFVTDYQRANRIKQPFLNKLHNANTGRVEKSWVFEEAKGVIFLNPYDKLRLQRRTKRSENLKVLLRTKQQVSFSIKFHNAYIEKIGIPDYAREDYIYTINALAKFSEQLSTRIEKLNSSQSPYPFVDTSSLKVNEISLKEIKPDLHNILMIDDSIFIAILKELKEAKGSKYGKQTVADFALYLLLNNYLKSKKDLSGHNLTELGKIFLASFSFTMAEEPYQVFRKLNYEHANSKSYKLIEEIAKKYLK